MTLAKPAPDPVDLSSLEFWAQPLAQRAAAFTELREERPISWHRAPDGLLMPDPDAAGFWAVTRHADIEFVSKNARLFCSGQGVQFQDIPEELLAASQSFLAMDDPHHARLRKLVSAAFTPKQVRRIEDQIAQRAETIVDQFLEHGDGDLVELVARPLPMWMIFDLMGLPPAEQSSVADAADVLVSGNDPDVLATHGTDDPLELSQNALMDLLGPGLELANARRDQPAEDLMTNLVQAEVDGQELTDAEIGAFFVLLAVAGNDTTRNTISHTAKAFTDHPEQWRLLSTDFENLIGTAVEEFVRFATPVLTFRRTATDDVYLHGQHIAAGDKVVMFYESGNRDAEVFADPSSFQIARSPNPHVGFGGGGVHFCLGNQLARTQLRAIFEQLAHRAPGLEVGEPTLAVGNFIHGVKALPATLNR